MITVGNDIVDLNDFDSNLKKIHPRFLNRVFNQSELLEIKKNNKISKTLLWTYWASKEAAYKALKRLLPKTIFLHKKFIFHQKLKKVTYDKYNVQCYISQDVQNEPNYIHILAYAKFDHLLTNNSCFKCEPTMNIYNKKKLFQKNSTLSKKDDSSLLKLLLIRDLSIKLKCPTGDIIIKKKDNISQIPYIFIKNQLQNIVLSLSHHGNYLSYVYYHSDLLQ